MPTHNRETSGRDFASQHLTSGQPDPGETEGFSKPGISAALSRGILRISPRRCKDASGELFRMDGPAFDALRLSFEELSAAGSVGSGF